MRTALHIPARPVYRVPLRLRPRGMGQTTGANSQYTQLALVVQQVEGYYPGSIAYTNNNPGNLMYAGQAGAIGKDSRGFAIFPDYATGFQALLNQLNANASRGDTIQSFTASYAPASAGNNPTAYANTIAGAFGLSTSAPLSATALNAGNGGDTSVPDVSGLPDLSSFDLSSLGGLDLPTLAILGIGGLLAVTVLEGLV